MQWKIYGFITVSKIRKNILLSLKEKPMLPSELTKRLDLDKSQVSRSLKELESIGMIKCLTPNHHKGRVYSLTKKGSNIVNKI